MKSNVMKKALYAGLIASALALAGCEADGNPAEGGGIGGGDPGSVFPNDGTTGGNITEGGTPIAGGNTGFNFICERSARAYGVPHSEVIANGLVGGPLTTLLNLLGGNTATRLLNSVVDQELAIDGELETASKFSLTVNLLSGLLSSVDQLITLGGTAPVGSYAVFGVSFPTATLELSLLQEVRVRTFLNGTQQETVALDASTLDLLGAVSVGDPRAFVGVKATKPWNAASIGIDPIVISANVGEAMFVHELCTGGRLVTAP
ncbi:MAG TPA: hypothetical protein VGE57_11465 [Solimonas sp.]